MHRHGNPANIPRKGVLAAVLILCAAVSLVVHPAAAGEIRHRNAPSSVLSLQTDGEGGLYLASAEKGVVANCCRKH
ncbi:MAG: hypothetical protein K9L28_08345 [Synergistales bacterium]|nr:hypothetical protein [Synergistales bacterium]